MMERWKGQRVCWLKWKEYHGFIPTTLGVVIEETENECLIEVGLFKRKIWTIKYNENDGLKAAKGAVCGYCKLLI